MCSKCYLVGPPEKHMNFDDWHDCHRFNGNFPRGLSGCWFYSKIGFERNSHGLYFKPNAPHMMFSIGMDSAKKKIFNPKRPLQDFHSKQFDSRTNIGKSILSRQSLLMLELQKISNRICYSNRWSQGYLQYQSFFTDHILRACLVECLNVPCHKLGMPHLVRHQPSTFPQHFQPMLCHAVSRRQKRCATITVTRQLARMRGGCALGKKWREHSHHDVPF